VSIPDDVDAPGVVKASGLVELPHHVCWSGVPRTFDLAVRSDRCRVYELVLREGTDEDVRTYIRVAELLDLWDELTLPEHTRAKWRRWLDARGYDRPAC